MDVKPTAKQLEYLPTSGFTNGGLAILSLAYRKGGLRGLLFSRFLKGEVVFLFRSILLKSERYSSSSSTSALGLLVNVEI